MTYFVLFLGLCFVLGGLAVAYNPSLYSGEVGLVLASIAGSGWLLSLGISFMSLVLFMVYLGGMSVDYVYSFSLVADSCEMLGGIGCDGVELVLVLGGSFWRSLLNADSSGWLLLIVGYAFCSIRF